MGEEQRGVESLEPGGRRLRPLALALLLPLLLLVVGGVVGIGSRLAGHGGDGPNPPARADAAMAFDSAHGVVVMFGGVGPDGALGDTWTWDGSSWTQQHPALSPSPREGGAMAYDPASGRVVLFGGVDLTAARGLGNGAPTETWTWDGSTWTQVATRHVPIFSEGPITPGGLAADPATHQLVMVGTQATPRPMSPDASGRPSIIVSAGLQTWTWGGGDWQERPGAALDAASQPLGRAVRLAWDAHRNALDMLVGSPQFICAEAGTVQAIPAPQAATPVQTAPTAKGSAGWTGYTPIDPTPPALPVAPPAVPVHPVPCAAQAAPSGGNTCTHCNGDRLYTWDGSAWHLSNANTAPPLNPSRLVSDPAGGGLLAVSGGQSWTLLGGTTVQHPMPHDLVDRFDSSVAGDEDRHQVVLFGGRLGGGFAGDTWTWDGKAWTHRAGTVPPLPTRLLPAPQRVLPASPVPGTRCVMSGGVPLLRSSRAGDALDLVVEGIPCGRPVTLTLVDGSGATLHVAGNPASLPTTAGTFFWRNWCGATPVYARVTQEAGDGHSQASTQQPVVSPPPCTDRSQPSTLSRLLAG